MCERNHILRIILAVFALLTTAPRKAPAEAGEDAVMKARFNRRWALASRANLALALTLFTTGSALAAPGTPAQRRARPMSTVCAPSDIPNVRAITASPRRQRASLGVSGRRCSSSEGLAAGLQLPFPTAVKSRRSHDRPATKKTAERLARPIPMVNRVMRDFRYSLPNS